MPLQPMLMVPYAGVNQHCRAGCGRIVADAGAFCRCCRERELTDEAIDRAIKRLKELEQ